MAQYNYILSDFPNNKYNSDTLSEEIVASSISSTLDRIDGTATGCSIFFLTDLSGPDQTTLDTVIANHTGEVAADAGDVQVKGALFIEPVDVSISNGDGPVTLTAIDASGQIVNSVIPPIYYGQEFQYAEELQSSTSTSTEPLIKLTLTTTDLPSGTYSILVAWMASHSSTSSDMNFDVTLNGVQMGNRYIQREPKDTSNVYSYYKIYYEVMAGVNDISLRYWNSNNSTTISDATIQLMRVK